jgi:hypothetical protein
MKKKLNCHECKHYFITWDNKARYGCRFYNMKTKENPATVVYRNSGMQCQAFSPKKKKSPQDSYGQKS